MLNEKIIRYIFGTAVFILMLVLVAGIIGIIGNFKTSRDIEEIRRVYRDLETAYSGIRESVGSLSGDIKGIGEGLSRVEAGIGGLEARTTELRKGLQQASATLGKVSGSVGELEALNREFSEILDTIVMGQ